MTTIVFVVLFSSVLVFVVQSQITGNGVGGSGNSGGATGFIPVVVNPSGSGTGGTGAAPSGSGTVFVNNAPSSGNAPAFNSPSAPSGNTPFSNNSPPSNSGSGLSNFFPMNNNNNFNGAPSNAPSSSLPYRPPPSNLDALTGYATDFLTSLSKDQLTAFLKVYFMSRMMGTSLLDPRALALTRSAEVDPQVRRAIETASTIPSLPSQMASLESTGVGAIIDNYAARMRSATPSERTYLARDYQNTIENLKLPKGVKYALKHVV